ncbi:MAG: M28 family peptidase [Candidatus Eisenbacteria bacterium]|nr:M28 family peptidase [Candidatus Eisenbacteria bacterium]
MSGATPSFDEKKAFRYLEKQVSFGPRIPGSEGQARTLQWLEETLRPLAPRLEKRSFTGVNPLTGESARGTNLIASFRPESKDRIFLGAHWDTRIFADFDPDPARRRDPVPGANDGGSGTAVLLVLAEVFRDNPPPYGVDLLFFDFEDQGVPGGESGWCLGSRSFVAGMALTGYRPRAGIVVDMVGGEGLRIAREKRSIDCCSRLVETLFRIGASEAPDIFADGPLRDIYDDHAPFIEAGIPAVDLIGITFPEWHTVNDLPDRCSPKSLGAVGRTLLKLIYEGHEIP